MKTMAGLREEIYRRIGRSGCAQCKLPLTMADEWWVAEIIPEGETGVKEKVLICQDCFDKMMEQAGGSS